MSEQQKISNDAQTGCRMCAIYLVERCNKKNMLFHIIRDPLVWGMYFLGWCNGINVRQIVVGKTRCNGCIRFLKTALEEKSPTFNCLNKFIGPRFAKIRNSMLTDEEIREGKRLAAEM